MVELVGAGLVELVITGASVVVVVHSSGVVVLLVSMGAKVVVVEGVPCSHGQSIGGSVGASGGFDQPHSN